MTEASSTLRSLSPNYVANQHGYYVKILKAELTKSGSQAPRNIALTGHYGSGKSSVLLEMQRTLEQDEVKVVNLALPSLGIGDGRIRKDGDKALDKTNLIQKEIVKQLLYRRKPTHMPASRYSRLDTFHWTKALGASAGIGVVAASFALLLKLPVLVRDALPSEAWAWVNDHLGDGFAGFIQWLSLLFVFMLTGLTAMWAQRLLQQRIRVAELAAGPTRVTLSDSSSSYFDEYLDEIVYFFQRSKTSVVIFEDLDRFKDPHIFETLRELNMLLNNAEQTGPNPIRFVYAIRDSIFEQLDVDTADASDEDSKSTGQGETRRLMSTNRTKFFDLVVPMVPFISHRTSRDLIQQELNKIVPEQRPGKSVVDIVGAHLTDMRLIKNICNEYEVFRRRVLVDGGLHELTADRLFASIVYKNLYLANYEKIRDGESPLDDLYRAYREWARQQTATARRGERSARARLRRLNAIGARSARLGERLQDVLLARHVQTINTGNARVVTSGTTYSWSEIATEAFWRTYLKDRGGLEVYYRPGYSPVTLTFDSVQTLIGYALSSEAWDDEARAELINEINDALSDQRIAQHSSMTKALALPDKLFSHGEVYRSMADVAGELFDGEDLVLELLRAGLIDENFTLYITQFPGQAISASAMNFIIKAVQPDVVDIEYHFGADEAVNTDDIKAVLDAEGQRLLGGNSIYNIEIVDYLMDRDPDRLDDPIRRLAANNRDRSFLDAYLTSGKHASTLVERLSGLWPGIFAYLIGRGDETRELGLVDAAIKGVSAELTYTMSTGQRGELAASFAELPTVKERQSPERALVIAETVSKMGLRIDDLSPIEEPLRTELSMRKIYPITYRNLVAVLGEEADLSLDRIKRDRECDVYGYVLDHLRDYLDALDEGTNVPTVADPERYADVLSDVGAADADSLEEVARRASADCMLSDFDELDVPFWPAVAAAHRLALTARNVAAYVDAHDVDSSLANWLRTAGAITIDPDDSTPLEELALKLLNATALGDEPTLKVVGQLGIKPESLSAASLQKEAHTMLPTLVQKRLVPDDADAYMSLGADEWPIKKRLIAVSKNFPAYATELPLGTDELFKLASGDVPDSVKDVLLDELDTFRAQFGPKGAVALASWAAVHDRTPAGDAIVTLATKGGSQSAGPVLKLLGAQATTIDLDQLRGALNALGKPYSQLTERGWERPKIDVLEGATAVLTRLKSSNIVSKFEENTKKKVFEVSKRHP